MFGQDFAAKHPEVVSSLMISASLDWAAMTIATALAAEDEPVKTNGSGIVRAQVFSSPKNPPGLVRP